ncbi:dimethyladenosine transferase [Bacillus sp. SG-1]|nr:dimethyladenosine transferase [Bacillus sp. SG-1]
MGVIVIGNENCWFPLQGARLRGAGGEPPQLRLHKKWKRPVQPRQANVPQRKKGDLSFYSLRVI